MQLRAGRRAKKSLKLLILADETIMDKLVCKSHLSTRFADKFGAFITFS
jgi:hypothetical protein